MKIEKIIGTIILVAVFILILLKLFIKDPEYYRETRMQRKQLKQEIDSLFLKQDTLKQYLDELARGQMIFYDIIDETRRLTEDNNRQIYKLRKLYNEKINSVDKYTISDLDSFFRSRYKQHYE